MFSDTERPLFASSLHQVLRPGGTYFMLCFSELEPGELGPSRVTQAEIRATFGAGWKINYIQAAGLESNMGPHHGWLASITRL